MHRMNAIGKFISNFRDFYNEINAATLTGAIDVIVVEQPDGSFTCSPFHVRFGKLGVLRSREKVVDMEINGEALDIHMKLGESGEAFFVEGVSPGELGDDEFIPPHLACSPIPHDDAFPAHFHDRDQAIDKLHDEQGATEFRLEEIKTEEQVYTWTAPGNNEDASSQTYSYLNDVPSRDFLQDGIPHPCDSAETLNSRDSSDIQLTSVVTDTQQQSVPKTFHAETLDDDKSNDKVRKISIANGDFRPIAFENEDPSCTLDSIMVQKPGEDLSRDDDGLECNSSLALARKDSYKENTMPVDGSLKPLNSNSGKRKKRRKSVMKRKAGQKKNNNNNGGGSSSQTEQSEQSEAGSKELPPKEALKDPECVDDMETNFQGEDASRGKICEQPLGPIITVTSADSAMTASEFKNTSADNLMELSRIQHASTETDFHFFSDTEITPGCTPPDSRPCSPVQSDTEFEMKRQSKAVGTEDGGPGKSLHGQLQQSWRWGELPSPPPRPLLSSQNSRMASKKEAAAPEPLSSSDEETSKQQQEAAAAAEAEAQRSMLSGMFSFMKKTKRIRHNPESEGIYLSDLNSDELDPEVAALYFPTSYRQQGQDSALQHGTELSQQLQDEEDAESGNGTSLPQSPHSVEGAIGGPKSLDSDFEEPKHSVFEKKSYGEISMSLSGGLVEASGPSEDTFLQNLVSYNDLVQDPKIIENPNLVIRLNGKYYNWRTVCPMVMSLVIFQKPLPQEVVETLSNEYMPLKKAQKKDVKHSGYTSWWSWRRTSEPKKLSTAGLSEEEPPSSPESEKPGDVKQGLTPDTPPFDIAEKDICAEEQTKPVLQSMDSIEEEIQRVSGYVEQSLQLKEVQGDVTGIGTQTNFPMSDPQKDAKEEGYSGSNSSDESDSGRGKMQGMKLPMERRSYYECSDKYRKTLRLSSDQIASLNLNEGGNEVVFSVTTAYQGTTRCKCHIYRWRYDDKVVISDIDGTITKSDVLGHILPIVGKDWAQSGVAQLFTKIKNNGYKLLYLSARAIGQAHVTREYLKSIKQGDLSLPDGPLLLNPTSLISAFHREVIEKKPEEFKISCLRDIQALFPDNTKPFYAGYGNRINDVWAYRAVGIPIFRIFTINHRGELKHELTQTFQSSYSNMSYIVDQMFPPPPEDTSEDFSNFIYWRDPIPDIVDDLEVLSEFPPTTPIVAEPTPAVPQ